MQYKRSGMITDLPHVVVSYNSKSSVMLDLKGKFLPDVLFSLLDQIHQNMIKVVFFAVLPSGILFGSLHVLLVCGAGNVAGIISQARHGNFAHPALMSAVPGEKRRERAFNGSFWHAYGLVGFFSLQSL